MKIKMKGFFYQAIDNIELEDQTKEEFMTVVKNILQDFASNETTSMNSDGVITPIIQALMNKIKDCDDDDLIDYCNSNQQYIAQKVTLVLSNKSLEELKVDSDEL